MYDIIIIGAGPAGLFSAISLSETGKKILLIEKNPTAGKKLLLSGSGQCNFTHAGETQSFFNKYGLKNEFIKPALLNFSNKSAINFFEKNNLAVFERDDGKIFPESLKSSDILNLLLSFCIGNSITIKFSEPVIEIDYSDNSFLVKTETNSYNTKLLILATGGMSYPKTGSTGDGYQFAVKLGHAILNPKPALVPLKIKNYKMQDLSGISVKNSSIKLFRNRIKIAEHRGDILFTHRNISGPAVLNISRYAEVNDILQINFIPDKDPAFLNKLVQAETKENGARSIKSILKKLDLPSRLLDFLLIHSSLNPDMKSAELSREKRNEIIESITSFQSEVDGTEDFSAAMATAGGINTDEINRKTMESKIIPGLYFAGEVMDIDGDTGGYNIQAAFSTAKLAADSIKKIKL